MELQLRTTFTSISETTSSDTLEITSATSTAITVTATSTGQSYVLDRLHGLELDFSGVTASGSTTTFEWVNAGDAVQIYQGSTLLTTLDSSNTTFDYTLACGGSATELQLLDQDDPKIKIIPPTCS